MDVDGVSMASFEVSGEPSILPYCTWTECKLQCVAVSFWQGLALFHLEFQEFGYPEFIFLGKEKENGDLRGLVFNATQSVVKSG